MERRDLLRAFGAATALAVLPRDAMAAWGRVASGIRPLGGLSAAHLALVDAIADTIIPRTDTPGASDVGVAAFVDVIVTEQYEDAERDRFIAGLDAIDASVMGASVATFAALPIADRGAAIARIEALPDRRAEPARTWWRLKSLVVHGYFTSERVMKDVLKAPVMPGAFIGNAPHVVPPRSGAENQIGGTAAAENRLYG